MQLGELWANLSLTLAAFADVARPFLQDTITKGPSGQETVHRGRSQAAAVLPGDRRVLRRAAARHATRCVPRADELASGFERGVKGLEGSPGLNRRLSTFLGDLEDFAQDPIVPIGFQDLIQTGEGARPADQPHHAGADGLQLHVAVLPQRGQHPQRRRLATAPGCGSW